ncbi:MAG: QacE family quaternary ammonium compound efflux SMR transporter [Desulfovibrio sp.]|mgnify:CR=1 FL=1|nr:MAG: QacE family quaternary ammonium compound efflux SMR transporter [Desulfovibrio sp.]
MLTTWLILFASIVVEVVGTALLKMSDGFTKVLPTVGMFIMYSLAFWGLSVVVKKMDVGMAYAIWAGLGTALVAMVGITFFGDKVNALKVASLALIIAGIVGLHFSSKLG